MGVIEELESRAGLFIRCPACDGEFSARKARLFDATRRLPDYATEYLANAEAELGRARDELKASRLAAKTKPQLAAESVRIGKVVEKIAPSLPGFPLASCDCRALFEPIDYVEFKGLSLGGRVDALIFVDVKSGHARLKPSQRQIRDAVEGGRVHLLVTELSTEGGQ